MLESEMLEEANQVLVAKDSTSPSKGTVKNVADNDDEAFLQPLEKNIKKSSDTQKSLPDGGWAWRVVLGSFLCNIVLDGIAFSYGILLIPLMKSFDSSRSVISNGGSILLVVYGIACMISGILIKKFGCRLVCILGCVIAALGIGLSVLSPNTALFLITYGFIGGYGIGTMYIPSMVVISDYFDKKRGLATGIADSGTGVGILVFAPMAAVLVEKIGWKGTNLVFASFCVASIFFASLMGPWKSGCFTIKEKMNKAEECTPRPSAWKSLVDAMNLSILINKMFLIVGISNTVACLGLFVPYFYLPDLVVEKNFTSEESSYLIAAMGISNTIGRIGVCWISDIRWLNSLWSCVFALFMTGLTMIFIPFCASYIHFMVLSLFFGFFSAALQMNPLILVDILGVENLSLALGYILGFRATGILCGPPAAGALYDGTQSYDAPFYVAGGCIIVSSLVLSFAAINQKSKRNNNEESNPKKETF